MSVLFLLGRDYSIPIETLCIGHMRIPLRSAKGDVSYHAEVLIINPAVGLTKGDNDNGRR